MKAMPGKMPRRTAPSGRCRCAKAIMKKAGKFYERHTQPFPAWRNAPPATTDTVSKLASAACCPGKGAERVETGIPISRMPQGQEMVSLALTSWRCFEIEFEIDRSEDRPLLRDYSNLLWTLGTKSRRYSDQFAITTGKFMEIAHHLGA
jgi:hypothetical protein